MMSDLKISIAVVPETGAAVAVVEFQGIVLEIQFERSDQGFEVASARVIGGFTADEPQLQDLINAAGAVVADLGDAMGRAHLFKSQD
jgi:hypothetical protein